MGVEFNNFDLPLSKITIFRLDFLNYSVYTDAHHETIKMLPRHIAIAGFAFNVLKARIFMTKDKERTGGAKKLKDNELQDLLNENPIQTLKKLANSLIIDESK